MYLCIYDTLASTLPRSHISIFRNSSVSLTLHGKSDQPLVHWPTHPIGGKCPERGGSESHVLLLLLLLPRRKQAIVVCNFHFARDAIISTQSPSNHPILHPHHHNRQRINNSPRFSLTFDEWPRQYHSTTQDTLRGRSTRFPAMGDVSSTRLYLGNLPRNGTLLLLLPD